MTTHANDTRVALVDSRTDGRAPREMWAPMKLGAAEIENQFAALEDGSPDVRGRREALVVHPQAPTGVRGLAPATQVALGVLLPGESSVTTRDNTNGLGMALAGHGSVTIGDRTIDLVQQDVWTKPTMRLETFRNTGSVPFRYIRYSNAALLESISAFYEDFGGNDAAAAEEIVEENRKRAKDLVPPIPVGGDGGQLLPYEAIIDIDEVPDNPLHFPWAQVRAELGGVESLKTGYNGRPLVVLYNPATGRLNGTAPSFFATILSVGGAFAGPTHRHMSSAINYHFAGRGWSVVEGQRFDWEAGDLMLSAPGWGAHGHTISTEGAQVLTVQDHPLHTSTGSLVWQEDIENGEILTLGSQVGFQTNLADYAGR
ncbi:cupin domain-containing protein [Parafrankia elaeagni]|uniref:hypothetical protein n=1 Tax=Parafrankia elaeagni TaxID=222534 RepID=UPI00037E56F5|nr:hypothetical protein [Parafrankia elaeagni]